MTTRPLETVYEETRTRVVGLIRDPGGDVAASAAAVAVPACPSWSVRDVLAHVTGLYSDIVSGNIGGAATDAWTAAQVEARRSMTIDELLAESDEVGPKLAAMIDDFPGRYGAQVVADLAVHEHDIRGALGRPGARRSGAVAVGTEFLLGAVVGPGAQALGVGPVEVRSGEWCWTVGTGESPSGEPEAAIAAAIAATAASAEVEPAAGPEPVGEISADPFELFRAFTGRRSAAQIRRFGWTVDPEPYLALFDLWPFTIRETDLVE